MKKHFVTFAALIAFFISIANAQVIGKGDFLLNADVRLAKFAPEHKVVSTVSKGTPVNVSAYYVFYRNKVAGISSGLHSTYFRHQTQDGGDYGTLALSIPLNIHFTLVPKLDPYLGYRVGYYFDGYNPPEKSIVGYYNGTFSELYLGCRYFFMPRISIYAEVAASEFELSGGISFKL